MTASPSNGSGAPRERHRRAAFTEARGRYWKALDDARCALVTDALRRCEWNIKETATYLGVARNNVHVLIRRFGLVRPERDAARV